MQFAQLNDAMPGDLELNPLAYDPDSYPGIDQLIDFMPKAPKVPVAIDVKSLGKNGLVAVEEMETYLSRPAISSSALKEMLKTPAHYQYSVLNKDSEKKKHFELGTFIHKAFLEPEEFNKCITEPKYSLAKTDDVINAIRFYEQLKKQTERDLTGFKLNDLKDYLSNLIEQCPYSMVPEESLKTIKAIEKRYKTYGGGIIPYLLRGGISELSFYGENKATGLPVKMRPDCINIAENIGVNAIISFKTTSEATVEQFYKDVVNYKYDLTEGMYQQEISAITGIDFNATITIMIQTVAPYLTAVTWWQPEDLQAGKHKYQFVINKVSDCIKNNTWPGFETMAAAGNHGIIDMELPEWNRRILEPAIMV
jgi:PDDEXK-like domain of unknown function (DUF3799)